MEISDFSVPTEQSKTAEEYHFHWLYTNGLWYSIGKTSLDVIFLWKEERVRLLVASLGVSTSPISSARPSTPPSDSPGPSKNAEGSNCKLFLRKIKVLEATIDMYMHPKQHTLNSTALLYEVYNDMEKLGLE
ncbi:hypothetical protein Tco_1018464 [Tanacetum coccineum]|uniref:Uncharacterized protein n=1 Tax=Tanacetum coccineum TaxID=301880 RepID=A0ABQ5FUT1_9ASTR